MTRLLEQGIEAIRELPDDRQDVAGELLLAIARRPGTSLLSAEQLEDVKLAIAEADRGEFASEEDMRALWSKVDA